MSRQIKGKCSFCGRSLGSEGMARHLGACRERWKRKEPGKPESGAGKFIDIALKGDNGFFKYWMYLQANSDAMLKDLDAFIRDKWVECCGHLSRFTIGGVGYSVYPDPEMDDRSMKVKLGDVLKEGLAFTYEYDFGTTTTLNLRAASTRQAPKVKRKSKITIIARNDPPQITCDACDSQMARNVCPFCFWGGGERWLCDNCAPRHKCVRKHGEETLMPAVNSPRVGICGYVG